MMMHTVAPPNLERRASPGRSLPEADIVSLIADACPREELRGRRVLLIVPDHTRTAPIGVFFRNLHRHLADVVSQFDVLIALGTHPPLAEDAICTRLEITPEERRDRYARVQLLNHAWDNPAELRAIGMIPATEIAELTGGRFAMEVAVQVNRRLYDYDEILIVGPVFPHEVVGFSGGNKYLFPGVSGPEVLNFFHWLGAVVTNPMIIGHAHTPVRRVVDRAGALVELSKRCFALVVRPDRSLAAAFAGTPESAWHAACQVSREIHITLKDRPFHTILSCAPAMYDELWTGGKCMYKLEPVLADGGELIIYAPHITEISVTHGRVLREIGYHCRDYYLKQWEHFRHLPWGVLAHSCHVFGQGTYENGREQPRARVTLATGIPESTCRAINLGYRDPQSLNPFDFANREDEGVLLVPKAGEVLFQLKQRPAWAGGS